MVKVKIQIDEAVAEYVRGKFFDTKAGAVRFPATADVYVTVYDLLQRRPLSNPVDSGNLEFVLPDTREGRTAGGKNPETYNYLSAESAEIIERKLKAMMWAELHDMMDENKHLRGIQFKETVYTFMRRYDISAITEEALLKNYQRWRDKQRRSARRKYEKR